MAGAREIPGLDCDEPLRAAAGKILWTRFDEMVSFTDTALAGQDIEAIHDMRVASRRLRATLELFRDVFPVRRYRQLRNDVKVLARALGEVRDLDVMLERLERDRRSRPASQQLVLREMIAELGQQRLTAREALAKTIERLEREDFRRQFLVLLAKETM